MTKPKPKSIFIPISIGKGRFIFDCVILCVFLCFLWIAFLPIAFVTFRFSLAPSFPATFEGDSSDLKHTQIVPTLDTPIEPGKNAIWTVAFQDAWKKIETDVLPAPVHLDGATDVWTRLNGAQTAATAVGEEEIYTAAGLVQEGALENITQGLAERFPGAPAPDFEADLMDGILGYSRLEVHVDFPKPYFDNKSPVEFVASDGTKTPIHAFGIRKFEDSGFEWLREQVRVLFVVQSDQKTMKRPAEFGLDLCATCEEDEVLVARLPRPESLQMQLETLQERIDGNTIEHEFSPSDVFLVPDFFFDVKHRFKDLEGRTIVGGSFDGWPLVRASQDINFRLDKSGSKVTAVVHLQYLSAPITFIVDGPFLIVLRKRGADLPYFVMWVENAELLRKWGG